MSRIPAQQDPHVPAAIEEIKAFKERKSMTINGLANFFGVDQGGLYRFLAGDRKSITAIANKVLCHIRAESNDDYVNNGASQVAITEEDAIILARVRRIWHGQPESFGVFLECLSVLETAYQVAIDTQRSRNGGGS
jgi:hypothetical protein